MPIRRYNPVSWFAGISLALLVAFASPTVAVSQDDAETVRDVFVSYQLALVDKRGRDSIQFVHPRTIKYFDRLRRRAMTATASQVRRFSLFDQIMVLYLRIEFGERDLAGMSAEDVFAVAVDRGLVGDNIDRLGVGEVKFSRNGARGRITRDGEPTPLYYHFRKAKDGTWRLDLANVIALGDLVFETLRKRQGLSKEKFVTTLLSASAGVEVPEDIWGANPDR